ncbi:hypothetical protein [Pseudonocardia sp.]|jgi:hypothetical protein
MKLMYAPPAEVGCSSSQYCFAHAVIAGPFAGSASTPTMTPDQLVDDRC